MRNRQSRAMEPRRLGRWSRNAARTLVVTLMLCGASLWGTTGGAQSPPLESMLEGFGMGLLSGDPPPIALPGLDGQHYALESLKGRLALLYFWATW